MLQSTQLFHVVTFFANSRSPHRVSVIVVVIVVAVFVVVIVATIVGVVVLVIVVNIALFLL